MLKTDYGFKEKGSGINGSKLCSIVIPNYNGQDVLPKCLITLKELTEYNNYEVIVVDDASTDNLVKMLREKFHWVKIIVNERNHGDTYSVNRGMKIAQGDFVLLLDSDVWFIQRGWLKNLIKDIESDPKIGIIAPKFLYPDGTLQEGFEKMTETICIKGATFLIKREVIEKIGYFDEGYFPGYFAETDFCHRAFCAGFKSVSTPNSVVIHDEHKTISKTVDMQYVLKKNQRRYWLLNYSVPQILIRIVAEIKVIICSLFNGEIKPLLKAYWFNIKNLDDTLKKRKERCHGVKICANNLYSRILRLFAYKSKKNH